MKILSIDVGMKCLAYCLFSIPDGTYYTIEKWGILNLCPETQHSCFGKTRANKPCNRKPKFHKNGTYYCKIHAKDQKYKLPTAELRKSNIKKVRLKTLKGLCDTYDISYNKKITKSGYRQAILEDLSNNYLDVIEKVNSNSINLVTYGRNLKKGFENIFKDSQADCVIIENQIGPLALRMKMLQGMIMQHFIESGCPIIEEISAANKLREHIPPKKKTTYSERKKLSINVTRNMLENNYALSSWISVFNTHKKKDDLADSFLQGIWYIKHTEICKVK